MFVLLFLQLSTALLLGTNALIQSDYTIELRRELHQSAKHPQNTCGQFKDRCERKCKEESNTATSACYPMPSSSKIDYIDSLCWCNGNAKGNLDTPRTEAQQHKVYDKQIVAQRLSAAKGDGKEPTIDGSENDRTNLPKYDEKQQTTKTEGSSQHQPQNTEKKNGECMEDDGGGKEETLEEFRQEVLAAHNLYRKAHGVPPMERDEKLERSATEWARKMAEDARMYHSDQEWRRKKTEGAFKGDTGESIAAHGGVLTGLLAQWPLPCFW